MGPVSFESLDGGPTRTSALRAARELERASIHVVSMSATSVDGAERFRIVVHSNDAAKARAVLEALDPRLES